MEWLCGQRLTKIVSFVSSARDFLVEYLATQSGGATVNNIFEVSVCGPPCWIDPIDDNDAKQIFCNLELFIQLINKNY